MIQAADLAQVLGYTPAHFEQTPIAYGALNPVTQGLWRVWGPGFSLVLKVLRPAATYGANLPTNKDYWPREALVYESGLLNEAAGLKVPKCYGVQRQGGGYWLWLQDLGPASPPEVLHWARQLAHWGAWGCQQPPRDWWVQNFAADWLQMALREGWFSAALDPATWAALPIEAPRLRQALQRLQQHGLRWAATLQSMPQTLCHHDCGSNNLFAVAGDCYWIDFGYMGWGALGEDLGTHIGTELASLRLDATQASAQLKDMLSVYQQTLLHLGLSPHQAQIAQAAHTALCIRQGSVAALLLGQLVQPNHPAKGFWLGHDPLQAWQRLLAAQDLWIELCQSLPTP